MEYYKQFCVAEIENAKWVVGFSSSKGYGRPDMLMVMDHSGDRKTCRALILQIYIFGVLLGAINKVPHACRFLPSREVSSEAVSLLSGLCPLKSAPA